VKIVKRNFSESPWRLETNDGRQVAYPKLVEHPDFGMTKISAPVCGATKAECLEKALAIMDDLVQRLKLEEAP
jgi:hypothetical protein